MLPPAAVDVAASPDSYRGESRLGGDRYPSAARGCILLPLPEAALYPLLPIHDSILVVNAFLVHRPQVRFHELLTKSVGFALFASLL